MGGFALPFLQSRFGMGIGELSDNPIGSSRSIFVTFTFDNILYGKMTGIGRAHTSATSNEQRMKYGIAILLLAFIHGRSFGQEIVREYLIEKKYLNIPVEQKQDRQRVVIREGVSDSTYDVIRIAEGKPDYWVFRDVSALKGKILKLAFSRKVSGIDLIHQDDHFPGEDSLYKEVGRPQFHFSSRRGWNNDPNGLIYHKGEYHLFYQHNPYEVNWGNMHWGHAVSIDLLHWTELPDALFPDTLGTMFSGSAVTDKKNTSGFGKDALVAIYTASGKKMTQNIAYSLDGGRSFRKYAGNPVLGPDRDPKVFWYEPQKKWVLVMYNENYNAIYDSKDLKTWTYRSKVNGFYECPEFFELSIDGNPQNRKWVMYGASGTYMIGTFDGNRFIPTSGKFMYTSGSLYAAQTYNDAPDGRRIQIGWGNIDHKGMPFNQLMLFPNELTLRTTPEGVRLFCEPIREIEKLHDKKYEWKNTGIDLVNKELSQLKGDLYHGILEFELDKGLGMELHYRGEPIIYFDGNYNSFNHIPFTGEKPDIQKYRVEFLIDRSSVEAYIDKGRLFLAEGLKLTNHEGLMLEGGIKVNSFQLYTLKSIW